MGHNKTFLGDGADSGVMTVSQVPAVGAPGRREARTGVGRSPVSVLGIVILATLMSAVSMLSLYGLWRFWPAQLATGPAPVTTKFSYFNWHATLTQDQQFFVVVALGGVIGSMLHGLRSLSKYIGERFLFRSWIPYYILLPLVGSLMATIVYLVLRGGLLPGATSSSQPDPYGVTAISALVGMFSARKLPISCMPYLRSFSRRRCRAASPSPASPCRPSQASIRRRVQLEPRSSSAAPI
jgi:hypothetical protein